MSLGGNDTYKNRVVKIFKAKTNCQITSKKTDAKKDRI